MISFKFDKKKQIGALELKVKKQIKEILSGEALLTEVGKFAVERIKYQARISKPLSEEGFKPSLAESTIKHRKYLSKYNATHQAFELPRANVTITGKFLDSLKYVFRNTRDGGGLDIFFEGDHPRYRGKSGYIGKVVKNADLAKWLGRIGFTVVDKAAGDNVQFTNRIVRICRQFIRRGLAVRNRL